MITLCVTAYNEEKNLKDLFSDFEWLLQQHRNLKFVIIDNGSTDDTWNSLISFKENMGDLIYIERLKENVGYGGGFLKAISKSETDIVALLSADRQYPIQDVGKVLSVFENLYSDNSKILTYGNRVTRFDSKLDKFVSFIYSKMTKLLLGISAKDINGQPKIFSRIILDDMYESLSNSFFFDAQILTLAKLRGHDLIPCDTSFVKRKYGISSWSDKRFEVYFEVLRELSDFRIQLRKLKL
jgi:glycosyltransferase involved in cell wall biosynthesis